MSAGRAALGQSNACTWSPTGSLRQMPLALIDQTLISAANFVTIVLLARALTLKEFGEFTLVYSAMLFFNTLQTGLVTQPHNILGVSRHGEAHRIYTSSTALSQILLALSAATLALSAWGLAVLAGWSIAPLLLSLTPAIVAWQLMEFARRALYTEGRLAAATLTNALGYGGQLLGISWLAWKGALSGTAALYATAVAFPLGAGCGIWMLRHSFSPQATLAHIRENWHFGKWIVGSEIVGTWCSAQLFVYLAAAMLGAAAAGVLRAVHTIFGPARIVADVTCTMLPIHLARVLATRGHSSLHTQLIRVHLVSAPLLGGYCLLVAVFAEPILRRLYGHRYVGAASVLSIYAAAAFLSYMMMNVAAALRAGRSTRALFDSQLTGSLVSLPLGWLLIYLVGIQGVAIAMVAVNALMILLLWRAYRCKATSRAQAATTRGCVEATATAMIPTPRPASALLLEGVFGLLDRAAISYCVTHGYDRFPDRVLSDVDVVMRAADVKRLAELLNANSAVLGARVVQWIHEDTYYVVLMGVGSEGVRHLCLDISVDYELAGHLFVEGEDILGSRRRCGGYWVPSPEVEFICATLRFIVKGRLTESRAARLCELYAQRPERCALALRRFVGARGARVIEHAAVCNDWSDVRARYGSLRSALILRNLIARPLACAQRKCVRQLKRLSRWCRPRHGLHIVLLGPDGAGKSSIAQVLRAELAPAFQSTSCRSFPPALLDRGDPSAAARPHDAPPRSYVASTIRALGYWLPWFWFGHLITVRLERARIGLSLHDRHFVDALVDPRRYRYGGAMCLLHWIWRITPKPDLVLVLEAPCVIIQQRKQDVPPEETARQCAAYRDLADRLPMARRVNAEQPLCTTAAQIQRIVIEHLADRVHRQLKTVSGSADSAAVLQILAALSVERQPWTIRLIGYGDQANVYAASAQGDSSGPELVVKLFKRDRPGVARAADDEFAGLQTLSASLGQRLIDGWRIHVPRPIFLSQEPLAVVMSKVPGIPLEVVLAEGFTSETVDAGAIGRVLGSAMERFWACSRGIYGDLNLMNVLCDPAARCISMVDPGMTEDQYLCPHLPRQWYPMSRDLAYLLFDMAASIRRTLWHPRLRQRQWDLLHGMAQPILGRVPTQKAQCELLQEIGACARFHLRRIRLSISVDGGRHLLLRCVASLRVRRLLSSLKHIESSAQPVVETLWWPEELTHDQPRA